MRIIAWWAIACVGVGCMFWAYWADRPGNASGRLSWGVIYVAKTGGPTPGGAVPFPSTTASLRLLPLTGVPAAIARSAAAGDPARGKNLELQLGGGVFEISLRDAGVTEQDLEWGRLPMAGHDEIVAGHRADFPDQVEIASRTFAVVGHLRRDAALFIGSYLVDRDKSVAGLFDQKDPAVHSAVVVRLSRSQLADAQIRKQLAERFPKEQFEAFQPLVPMRRAPFLGYLFGQALLLLGGSGGLIGLYSAAGRRARWRPLRDPLLELSNRGRLLRGLHVAYFGLYLAAALVIYFAPDAQQALVVVTRGTIQSGSGPLGIAGKAYATRSIPIAAAVTFAVNFFLGSIVMLTLPSLVIPGSGAIVAAFRATVCGLMLSPSTRGFAKLMVPHSGTLLIESEAYILATFFAVLVPVHLFRPDPNLSFFGRYGRVLLLNVKANLLVALVLIVAAVYEATEVILMSD